MIRCLGREEGAVSAEFAVMLPAVVLVLACALGGVQLVTEQLRLQGAVATAARLLGRGQSGADDALHEAVPGAALAVTRPSPLVCATATLDASLGVLSGITLRATACSLDDAQ